MIKIKNNKTKYYILIVLLLAILAVLIIPNLIISSMNEITKETAQKLQTTSTGEIKELKVYLYKGNERERFIEITDYTLTGTSMAWGVASYPGKVLYCSEHDVAFFNAAGNLTLEEVSEYGSVTGGKVYQGTYYCGCRIWKPI